MKVKREFECRLNSLYTHPRLGHLLDSGEIDFVILNILEELHKCFGTKRTYLYSGGGPTVSALLRGDIWQALLDARIVYKSKYYDILHMEHYLYGHDVLGPYIENIRSSMSTRESFEYKLFKKAKGVSVGGWAANLRLGRPGTIRLGATGWRWQRHSMTWEFSDLYFSQQSYEEEVQKNNSPVIW